MAAIFDIRSENFSYIWSTSHPDASYQVSSVGLSVPKKKWKKDFQDGGHGSHLGFPIGTILAIFYLQVTPMLPTKIQFRRRNDKYIFKMAAILDFQSEWF